MKSCIDPSDLFRRMKRRTGNFMNSMEILLSFNSFVLVIKLDNINMYAWYFMYLFDRGTLD